MTGHDDEPIVYAPEIRELNGKITDRALRKWIELGRFPKPDGNINGRNFWLASTVRQHRADMLAGKFSQLRRPVARASAPETA